MLNPKSKRIFFVQFLDLLLAYLVLHGFVIDQLYLQVIKN